MNPATVTGGGSNGGFAAVKALILGSMMLSSSAEGATEEEDDQSDYTPAMVVGAILLALGAIQVGQVVHSAASYCLRRLKGPEDQSDLRQRRRESDGISSEEDDSILVVSEDEIATSSHQKRIGSGGTSSRKSSKRSGCGSAVRTTSQKMTSRSGSEHCDEGASSLSLRRQSGLQRQHDLAADAAGSNDLSSGRSGPGDPAAAERSRSSSTTSGLASVSDSAAQKEPSNPWNHFQHANKGKGWSKKTMSRAPRVFTKTGTPLPLSLAANIYSREVRVQLQLEPYVSKSASPEKQYRTLLSDQVPRGTFFL
eukprot:s860_g9.t1